MLVPNIFHPEGEFLDYQIKRKSNKMEYFSELRKIYAEKENGQK